MTGEGAGKPPAPAFSDFGLGAFTEFWTQAGKVAAEAQQQAGRMVAEAMKAMPALALPGTEAGTGTPGSAGFPMPGFSIPGFPAANPADLGQAGQAMAELWTAATTLSGSMTKAMGGQPGAMDASLRAMADPRTWLAGMGGLDGVAGAMAEGPRLADLWTAERQQARTMKAWLEVRRCALEHNAVLLKAWMDAGKAFNEELAGRTRAAGQMPDPKAVQALWIETANRVLLETQRSDRFLQTQAATVRAGTEMRMAHTDAAEHWAHGMGLPTRTEMDDVHRTLTTLRREVRTLQRQARDAATRPAPAAPPAPSIPAPSIPAPLPAPARGKRKNAEGVP